jgi:hypothetical protein
MKLKGIMASSIIALLAGCAGTAIAANDGPEKKEDSTAEKYFHIFNYRISRADADIELNGVPLAKSESKYGFSTTGFSDVGMWIIPGANSIAIRIRSMKKEKDSSFEPKVELSVSIAKEGQMSDEGIKILEYTFPEKEGALKGVKFPVTKTVSFTPKYPPPSELWGRVKPAVLDEKAKRDIRALVSEFHGALVKRDVEKLYALTLFKNDDVTRLRHGKQEEPGKIKEMIRELVTPKEFVMEALDVHKLVMRPVAGGRLVWITGASGDDPVRTKKTADGSRMTFSLYVALMDGKWVIVR